MKYCDMKKQTDKYGFEYIADKCILVGKNKRPCLICGELTDYIDVCSEAHFCSDECVKAFYQQLTEYEKLHYDEESIE